MFDKLQTVKNYIQDVQQSYENIVHSCKLFSNNLILINSNTPFSIQLLYRYLGREKLVCISPFAQDVLDCGSLGEFLRLQTYEYTSANNVLILDMVERLGHISSNISETVDIINVNRDLFKNRFNSTIIIASPKLTYAIRRYARDFWSCVNIFVDTTKWFCNPVVLPIVSVRVDTNSTKHLIDIYKKNQMTYNKFINLQRKIQNKFEQYDHEAFLYFYNAIKDFPYAFRCELLNVLSDSLIKCETSFTLHKMKLNDLRELAYSKESDVNMLISFAEYFFQSGCYLDAKSCYQRANLFLNENWFDDYKEFVLTFLHCNILVCEYMKEGIHSPRYFKEELEKRFEYIENELLVWQKDFIENYLFLIDITICHHTYAQHKDILDILKSIKAYSSSILNFATPYNALLVWEIFNSKDFQPVSLIFEDPVLSEIYLNIQYMIKKFCKGDFKKARYYYKETRKLSRIHGYMQILNFVEIFNDNMIWLYNESMKN